VHIAGNPGCILPEYPNDSISLEYAEKVWEIEHSPDNLYNIGACKYTLKDYEGAVSVFLRYLKDDKTPFKEVVFYHLGNSYAELNDDYNAQRCWDKANKLAGYDLKSEWDKANESAGHDLKSGTDKKINCLSALKK